MAAKVDKIVFYVATNGSDEWSGRLPKPNAKKKDGPFATLTRARDAVRELKHSGRLSSPVEVRVRGGIYRLEEPLRLIGGDSGTARCPVTYRAYPGEKPVLCGGRRITQWKRWKGRIMCAELPEVRKGLLSFRQLFCDGERMTQARWPKRDRKDPLYGGWAFVEALAEGDEVPEKVEEPSSFRYEKGDLPNLWAKPRQGEVFIVAGLSWISDAIPIRSVDRRRRLIHMKRPVGPSCNSLGVATHLMQGNRYFVQNMIEDLTEPGEWCVDTDTGMVYFWPPAGRNKDCEVTVPVTNRLVQMIGSEAAPLHHVCIRGFTLTQTQALFPTAGSYYKTPNAGQALYMENTQDCCVADNLFRTVGGDAVRLQNNNARNSITGNEITDTGAYGIFIGSYQKGLCRNDTSSGDIPAPAHKLRDPMDQDAVIAALPRSRDHLISNNDIHHVGVFEKHAQGVAFFGVAAPGCVVSHNRIRHTPRFGIGFMSGMGPVTVEYNNLAFLSEETCDTGGITSNRWYTSDAHVDLKDGLTIRYNRIADVIGCGAYGGGAKETGGSTKAGGRIWAPYYSWAIYFDNGPMDVKVYGNICIRNTIGGIMICGYCRNVLVENNIFVDSDSSQAYVDVGDTCSGVRIRRNIFSYSNPKACLVHLNGWTAEEFSAYWDAELPESFPEIDRNLYSLPAGAKMTFNTVCCLTGVSVKDKRMKDLWHSMGYEVHAVPADPMYVSISGPLSRKWDVRSVQADAMFVDSANDNYDLKRGSPARKLGFKPIDSRRIGLLKK